MGGGGRRGVLYHHLFSSRAEGFLSEPAETQAALASVQAALAAHPGEVTYLVDRGFDDDEVWGRIWAAEQHVVGRVFHFERLVEAPAADGAWGRMPLAAAAERVRPVAELAAQMLVRKRGQRRETRQDVAVRLAAGPVRVPYRPPDAPRYPSARQHKDAWLVRVEVLDVEADPWWLLTDWPVEDAAGALRVFRMYRQRWAAEDAFKFAKDALGWEDVQLMDLAEVQTLSALGWVAAAFLYDAKHPTVIATTSRPAAGAPGRRRAAPQPPAGQGDPDPRAAAPARLLRHRQLPAPRARPRPAPAPDRRLPPRLRPAPVSYVRISEGAVDSQQNER